MVVTLGELRKRTDGMPDDSTVWINVFDGELPALGVSKAKYRGEDSELELLGDRAKTANAVVVLGPE